MSIQTKLSPPRISRIRAQGYDQFTDQEITELAFGNRFAYRLCTSILTIGVLMAHIPILTVMMAVAFVSILLPNHLFDYIYNWGLAGRMNRPQLPPRSRQLKFACIVATIWIGTVIALLHYDLNTAACIAGMALVGVAALVSTTDFCLPSFIYNATFGHSSK